MNITEYNARASVLDNPAYLADLDAGIALHQPMESPPEWVGGFADPMADVIAWPALEAIPDESTTAPDAFPFHALGSIMGNAARAIASDVQAPDSLAGGSVLAAASLAVQPLANVMLPHGQRSPLSVFVITGAGSGDRKSAVDAVACKEVEEVRKQQARDFSRQMARYDADMGDKGRVTLSRPSPHPRA